MQNIKSISALLSAYRPITLGTRPQAAAVMVILLNSSQDDIEIVLTKRSSSLLKYAGDFSFPGGMNDQDDVDLYSTATREVQEELNLPPTSYQKIGQLDDFEDRYGNLVRPYVVWMDKRVFENTYKLSSDEIS